MAVSLTLIIIIMYNVNPVDMTIRSYWASDIINKLVYSNGTIIVKKLNALTYMLTI